MTLDDEDITAIATRIAARLRHSPAVGPRLVDAAQLAEILGVERDWIYAHANDLDAIRLGGPRGRLRFDPNDVIRTLRTARPGPAQSLATRPARRRPKGSAEGLELIAYES